jgi:outer membrane protein, heavy metal efflux system
MRIRIIVWSISLIALLCSISAAAAVRDLTLRQALALTLKQNPELAAFSWDIRSADARLVQTRLWPNPELGTQTEDVAGTKEASGFSRSQTTIQLSQVIELGGKHRARVRQAAYGRELAKFDYESKRLEVLKKTTQAFVDVLAGQERLRLAQQNLDLVSALLPDIKKRIEAGKASSVEQTRVDVEVASVRIELEQAKRTLLAARQRLSAQWGSTKPDFDRAVGDLETIQALPSLATLSFNLSLNPELTRWEPEKEKREATLRLQQADAVPNLTVSAGPRYIVERGEWTQVVGFSLPLPLWNRNQGAILEAESQLAKLEDEKRGTVSRLSTELNDAYQTVARTRDEVRVLKDSVLPGAEKSVTTMQEGYQAGRFSYLDVNDARRTLNSARVQYVQALSEYHKAVAEIEALTNRPFHGTVDISK